jgi:hypothetical protein
VTVFHIVQLLQKIKTPMHRHIAVLQVGISIQKGFSDIPLAAVWNNLGLVSPFSCKTAFSHFSVMETVGARSQKSNGKGGPEGQAVGQHWAGH